MSGANASAVELAHGRVGMTLHNKWRLDRVLGVGGMAAVYAATHRNGARGAIKMLHLAVSLDADVRRRFLREGYLANTVAHPGSVRVLDDDVAEDGSAYLVMELLEGESLDALAARRGGSLPPAEVLAFADRLLDVIAAAHQRGIVHRDIKPENIFLTQDGVLKLLDFGIARLHDGSPGTMTVEGSAFGTPAFMAPEQALGRTDEIDGRTDIFSVGATLFFLLTGRCVHVTRTLNEQIVAQASRPPPPLAVVAPHLPAVVGAVVDRALGFERERRWPDARTMREAVRSAQAALAAGGVHAAPPPPVPPSPSPAVIGSAPALPSTETVAPSVQAAHRPGGSPALLLGGAAGVTCVIVAIVVLRLTTAPAATPSPLAHGPDAPGSALVAQSASPASPTSPAPSAAPPAAVTAPASAGPDVPAATASATSGPSPKPPAPPVARPTVTTKKPPTPGKSGGDSWLDRQH